MVLLSTYIVLGHPYFGGFCREQNGFSIGFLGVSINGSFTDNLAQIFGVFARFFTEIFIFENEFVA